VNYHHISPVKIERRLLILAAVILFVYATVLSLSPAGRERTWDVEYRWSHWIGLAIWAGIVVTIHFQLRKKLPDSDPFIFPLASFLAGLGILSIWRLVPSFGMRQAIWLAVGGVTLALGVQLNPKLSFLRRYKYLLLFGGILLTSLTLFFGTNPLGGGPRLWLGCCGIYLQPSEPLKLLLVVYLSAYLADHLPFQQRFFPLILPTFFLTGLALLILIVQRDLGTASIFIFLYTVILYLATGRKRVILASIAGLVLAGVVGYYAVDIIRVRLETWLNPWSDPSGAGYQAIQSLMAIANGGIPGRGPGMGYPGLVPVAISDFIFSALAEETGLIGTGILLCILGVIIARGIRTALKAPDNFRRLLSAGLTAYIGAQSILIIGGNMRLLPLTGVTLPFVSYGGSSLLTSLIAILLLLLIGSQPEEDSAPMQNPTPFLNLALLFGVFLLGLFVVNSWWSIWRADDLLTRSDNPRRAISDLYVARGDLIDRSYTPINDTQGETSSYFRNYLYPDLGAISGYTNSIYGQSGLELSLDPYLRGLQGNPKILIWWERLLYGTPPPGLTMRLSLDLSLQRKADELLGDQIGAAILMNAKTGEILAMASHPTFDPNNLSKTGETLADNPESPLLNRAAQGLYPPGTALTLFVSASEFDSGKSLDQQDTVNLYDLLGFYTAPVIRLPVAPASPYGTVDGLLISPLQMALAVAALANDGIRPPGQIAMAANTFQQGWIVLPPLSDTVEVFNSASVAKTISTTMVEKQPYWRNLSTGSMGTTNIVWFMGGTPPGWQGTPLVVVVALEDGSLESADKIGHGLIRSAIEP
jgi:cell division protein FtsW (lipid II flippase)